MWPDYYTPLAKQNQGMFCILLFYSWGLYQTLGRVVYEANSGGLGDWDGPKLKHGTQTKLRYSEFYILNIV